MDTYMYIYEDFNVWDLLSMTENLLLGKELSLSPKKFSLPANLSQFFKNKPLQFPLVSGTDMKEESQVHTLAAS